MDIAICNLRTVELYRDYSSDLLYSASYHRKPLKYRSRTEIAAEILEAANGGATKTKIMYRAFLSYAQLKEYLVMLSENGLLEYNKAESLFKTSGKGIKFLGIYQRMHELAPRPSMPDTISSLSKM